MKLRLVTAMCTALLCACASQPATKAVPTADPMKPSAAAWAIIGAIGSVRQDYISETDTEALVDSAIAGLMRRAGIPGDPDDIHSQITRPLAAWEIKNPADSSRARRLITAFGLAKEKQPELSNEVLAKAAIDNMLSGLKGTNSVLTRKQFRELLHGRRSAGVGLILKKPGKRVFIVHTLPDSPARQAGLTRGDAITAIGGQPVADKTLPDVVDALNGTAGSSLTVTVRAADGQQRTVRLTRAFVRYTPFEVRWYAHGIAYLQINAIARHTARDIRTQAADWAHRPEGLKGVILDLRDSPGGVLGESARLADLFLRDGAIAKVEARSPSDRSTFDAGDDHSPLESVPMVVLVNRDTYSGAELVAAALQFHHRALVIGYHTAGIGLAQSVIPLRGGMALRLTTGRMLTAGMTPLQDKGVSPDICLATKRNAGCREDATAPDALAPYISKAMQILTTPMSEAQSTGPRLENERQD